MNYWLAFKGVFCSGYLVLMAMICATWFQNDKLGEVLLKVGMMGLILSLSAIFFMLICEM